MDLTISHTGATSSRRFRPVHWCVLCGLVLGLALAACTGLILLKGFNHVMEEAEAELQSLAIIVAEQADRNFQSLEVVQSGLIEELRPATMNAPGQLGGHVLSREFHEAMKHRMSGLPFIDALTVIGRDGQLVATTRDWPAPAVQLSDRDYFKRFLSNPGLERLITEPVQNRGNGAWTIYNARKIAGLNGEFLGLSLGAFRLDYFGRLFDGLPLKDGNTIGLFRPDGLQLARRPHVDGFVGQEFRSSAVAKIPPGADQGVIRHLSAVDGAERLLAVRRLPNHPIAVVATRTVQAITAEWRNAAYLIVAVALMVEVIIAGVVVVVTRQFRSQDQLARAKSAEIEARAAAAVSSSALALAEAEVEVSRRRQQVAEALTRENRADRLHREDQRLQNERFAAALKNMSHGLAMFGPDRKLVVCNERYVDIYRLPPDLSQPGASQANILDFCLRNGLFAAEGAENHAQHRIECASGSAASDSVLDLADSRVIAVSHRPTPDGGWVSVHEDITAKRRAEAELSRMARYDALTRLPNRVLFEERLDEALLRLTRGAELAVLSVDLDKFSSVNEALGHRTGDQLLRAAAERLEACISNADTLARFTGDKFSVLQVASEQPEGASTLARRILEAMSPPYSLEGREVVLGVSVGVALAPSDTTDAAELLKRADLALRRAKEDGRGRARFFEADMDAKLQARRTLELDLRTALITGEFELHYQPILDVRHSRTIGFEALLRWRHPRRGMVSPADFIPAAEEIGLIVPLGEWVLREACREAANWPETVRVAVNLSPAQFASGDLISVVTLALRSAGLAPSRLELEITESVLLVENEANVAILHSLRALGVRISLDDFGTGYSSLAYLRCFPFDKIKIDQSFVRDMSSRSDCAAIVAAVAGLARTLGMTATAEGVETQDQLGMVTAAGCSEVQGFLFSRPRPAAELSDFIWTDPTSTRTLTFGVSA